MLGNKLHRIAVALLVLISSVLFSGPVSAVGESVTIQSFDTMACQAGELGAGIVVHVNGTEAVSIRFTLDNLSKTTSSTFTAGILPSGTYGFSVNVPASTAKADNMTMSIDLLDEGSLVLVSDALSYACGVVPPIPTINNWGIVVFVLMLLGLARRRFTASN